MIEKIFTFLRVLLKINRNDCALLTLLLAINRDNFWQKSIKATFASGKSRWLKKSRSIFETFASDKSQWLHRFFFRTHYSELRLRAYSSNPVEKLIFQAVLSLQKIKTMFFSLFKLVKNWNHVFWALLSLQRKINFVFFKWTSVVKG